ncbi:hypothetical protein GmHk_14G041186 [Glycine max]|nr:hypothetical protein GmHk_14G041186 [Glycine max]
MQRRSTTGDLIPIGLEINATCRRHNAERIRKFLRDLEAAVTLEVEPRSSEASFSFLVVGHSHIELKLMDASGGGKIKMKTLEEAMDLIESMAASDIAILRDRAQIPTKKSLLELTSQDALLAQNKLLSKQLEALTETLCKLPTQLHSAQTSHSSILQVAGCTICGGAHESGCCIPNEEQIAHERQWQNHPGNQFNRDQGGSSTRSQQQMPSLYDRTTKLEETLAQFMQSTESAIKNLEVQVGQLAKQLVERPSNNFTTNTEKNPEEECKAVMTRSRMAIQAKEGRTDQKVEGFKQQLADQPTLEPIDDLVELEEIVEEAEGDEEEETPIRDCQERIKKKEEKEKEKEEEIKEEEEEKEKKLKKKNKKRWLLRLRRRRARKDKERHLAKFLDIFKKLEITFPFGEALQQMPLYAKFFEGYANQEELKRKSLASSSSHIRFGRSRFHSQEAWDRYKDIMVPRKLLPERNVVQVSTIVYYTEFDEFKEELERKKWDEELTSFIEGSIDVAIVKEFYANLYDLEDKSPKQVRVSGHLIKFDEDTLNTFLKTPVILEEGENLCAYSRFALLRLDPQELAAKLCIPGRGF